MADSSKKTTTIQCLCGSVVLEATGAPIISVTCYCDDCQAGARLIEALPNSEIVEEADGGTSYALYRKDKIQYLLGMHLLKGLKLKEKSPTNRVIATCCNSLMLISFDDSKHWIDIFRARIQGNLPPIEMRICTKFRTKTQEFSNEIPSFPTFPLRFKAKLAAARFAMWFS
jgi:hypothetical protein